MAARVRWFARSWWREWNWLIDRTPTLRGQLNFLLGHGQYDYRTQWWQA